MSEDKSLAEFYYEELLKSDNKVKTLVNFYRSLFDVNANGDIYKIFSRLYKVYGSEIIYFSLLDCSDVENVDTNRMTGLIVYFAKKRLKDKYSDVSTYEDLNSMVDKVSKELSKKRRIKTPGETINDI